jgi:5-hydroxyisourate hydrolase-like protein (transthyretin family)
MLTKNCWARFLATFSQTHPVALAHLCSRWADDPGSECQVRIFAKWKKILLWKNVSGEQQSRDGRSKDYVQSNKVNVFSYISLVYNLKEFFVQQFFTIFGVFYPVINSKRWRIVDRDINGCVWDKSRSHFCQDKIFQNRNIDPISAFLHIKQYFADMHVATMLIVSNLNL